MLIRLGKNLFLNPNQSFNLFSSNIIQTDFLLPCEKKH